MRSALLLPLLLALPGCIIIYKDGGPGATVPPEDTFYTDCTMEARASVVVTVVDAAGAPLPDATVTWSTGGGEPQAAECWDGSCAAGYEVSGEITVYASISQETEDPCCWLADGTSSTVTVPMTEDGCHVETQELTLTLEPTLTCADAAECG